MLGLLDKPGYIVQKQLVSQCIGNKLQVSGNIEQIPTVKQLCVFQSMTVMNLYKDVCTVCGFPSVLHVLL